MARCLFVEPFFGGSHRSFAEGLGRHSRHEIVLLTLPAAEWRRRMRRGAQELAPEARMAEGAFDLVIATDMLDLATFLALTRPRFSDVPVLLFMHENQFTYPRLRGTKFNSWFGQVNYLSACVADRVAFNSSFHRDDFLGALRTLSSQPNNWLLPQAIEGIEAKSFVLPVGVELARLDEFRCQLEPGAPPLLLWNHRWEFDKAPEVFARAVRQLAAEGLDFRIAIAGEPGDNPCPALFELRDEMADRIEHFGFIEDCGDYARLLWRSDIVVSTARHEFFGVGMVEALYCGCLPVAPRRFNYPALVPQDLQDACLFEDEAGLVARLRRAIVERTVAPPSLRATAEEFGWDRVKRLWDSAIDELAAQRPTGALA